MALTCVLQQGSPSDTAQYRAMNSRPLHVRLISLGPLRDDLLAGATESDPIKHSHVGTLCPCLHPCGSDGTASLSVLSAAAPYVLCRSLSTWGRLSVQQLRISVKSSTRRRAWGLATWYAYWQPQRRQCDLTRQDTHEIP